MRHLDEKAIRLVESEKVVITWRHGTEAATGTVDGETDTYQVAYSPEGRVCTCVAATHHRVCSHVVALELAVLWEAECS
jgi:hypothetical protein